MLGFDPKEKLSLHQAVNLMKFGNTFGIKDPQYWRTVNRMTEEAIGEKKFDFDTLFGVATYLKSFGMITNFVLRRVAENIK